ncbi:MAG: glycosyl hydrolase family 28-related protein [Janthinobacterium lividum]
MKRLSWLWLLACLCTPAWGQSAPSMVASTTLIAPGKAISSSYLLSLFNSHYTGIAAKVDAAGGKASGLALTGGSATSTDLSLALATEVGGVARTEAARVGDVVNVKEFGAACDGVTDDTAAFQSAFNAATSILLVSGRGVQVPEGAHCVISSGLTATVGTNRTLSVTSRGLHGAKLVYPTGFVGTGLGITLTGASASTDGAGGFGLNLSGLTFERAGTDTGGTAISVTTSGGGAAMPALSADHLTFTSTTGGSWAAGLAMVADNVTTIGDIFCTVGFKGTCVSYDTPGQISVEHHLKDIYINGGTGSIGIAIGHSAMTGSLQGFTIRGLSCTGSDYCIKAQGANDAIDEIDVEGSQLNSTIAGIYDNGGDTVIAIGNYFLSGARAMDIENNSRLVVTGNTFYLGPPSVGTTTNISIYTASLGGGSAAGSVISGNVFTNLYGIPVYLGAGSNYVTVTGNTCLGNQCVTDASGIAAGSNQNNVGPNLDSGNLAFATAPWFYSGLNVGARGTSYPLAITADGVGNALIRTLLTTGAGIVEIGPNVKLDGSVQIAGTIPTANITTGAINAATVQTLIFDPAGGSPGTSSATCSKGQTAWTTGYLYICVAANTWQRAALSSF